uniref:NADH-ubiquinone oxidoreductase chain 4 n=1 Tax=Argulus americanus TaxID=260819 RepID=Q6SL28_9CRUS|nr:NADH dehydrogenase subunit 4 [Argulus americanus]AAS00845.1 NADH dehydrogenase subunit 4 [Argulus americanus]
MLKFMFMLVLTLFLSDVDLLLMSLFILGILYFISYSNMNVYIFGFEDQFSWLMIILSIYVVILSILAGKEMKISKIFLFLNLKLLLFLYISFSTSNFMMFYFTFESSLIFIFLIVSGWGYHYNRLKASLYLLFYTLFFSLPMLIGILFFLKNYDLSFFFMKYSNDLFEKLFLISIVLGMLVKIPMWGIHLWLPKAHVEASASGSMLLAGILLKLGGYGLWRINVILNLNEYWMMLLFIFLMMGSIIICLECLMQSDLKTLIAYSSVCHMGPVALMLILGYSYSWASGGYMMFAHGLSSCGLFYLSGLIYSRFSTRSTYLLGGCLAYFPKFSMWWFIFCSVNLGAPPFLNLFSEIMTYMMMYLYSYVMLLIFMTLSFFSAAFSLYLYISINQGMPNFSYKGYNPEEIVDNFILFMCLYPLVSYLII